MSRLKVFREDNVIIVREVSGLDAIAGELHKVGVRYERWEATQPLGSASSNDEIIQAYRTSVDRLMKEYDFQSVDVIAMTPDHADKVALRKKFLDEHIHTDFEVRFFVEGKGLFFLHANEHVYGILCQQGDLLSVPANMPHWFDMGENPELKCIRLFTTPDGWVANYTGNAIARSFPKFEHF